MLKQLLMVFTLTAAVASLSNAAGLAPQTSDKHGVRVTVIPRGLSPAARTWDFEVVLETHSGNLSEDLAQSAALIAHGKRYAPLGWDGSAPGGHHRKGKLRFAAIVPRPASVELQIRLGGENAPRSFSWTLDGK